MSGKARPVRHIDFHISYRCARKCLFCSESGRMESSSVEFVPAGVIAAALQSYRRKGFHSVLFTGGEPFLHPELLEILSSAKNMGYMTEISTSGVSVDPCLFKSAARYINRICVSFHAHTPELFDEISNTSGGFEKLDSFLESAKDHLGPVAFMANVVLTRHNAAHIEDIVRKICSYGVFKLILLSNVAPEGRALEDYEKLALRLPEVSACVEKAKDFLWGGNIELHVFGAPFCSLGVNGAHSNDIYWYPRMTVELDEKRAARGEILLAETISMAPVRERVKPPLCDDCSSNDDSFCAGVFEKYLELYGSGELKSDGAAGPAIKHGAA